MSSTHGLLDEQKRNPPHRAEMRDSRVYAARFKVTVRWPYLQISALEESTAENIPPDAIRRSNRFGRGREGEAPAKPHGTSEERENGSAGASPSQSQALIANALPAGILFLDGALGEDDRRDSLGHSAPWIIHDVNLWCHHIDFSMHQTMPWSSLSALTSAGGPEPPVIMQAT